MAEIVINEVLCFVKSHFGRVLNDSIKTVISTFFTDDELMKAKTAIHAVCMKNLAEGSVPSIIARKGDNKKKADADDIMVLFALLDENDITTASFVAQNLRRVPLLEPGAIDLCFLLETIEDMKKKVEALCDVKKQVADLSDTINKLVKPDTMFTNATTTRLAPNVKPAVLQQQSQQQRPYVQRQPAFGGSSSSSYAAVASIASSQVVSGSTGMAADSNLQVALPTNSFQYRGSTRFSDRRPTVIGSKRVENAAFKASTKPREFHLHLGNLELNTTADQIKDFVDNNNIPICILSCEIVRSTRWEEPRSLSAHVVINILDKEKALVPESWPDDVTVRPWRQRRSHQTTTWGDEVA
jgi:hypothetical protein